jgi:hypothetical protein
MIKIMNRGEGSVSNKNCYSGKYKVPNKST